AFEIGLYNPGNSTTVYLDNIRLSKKAAERTTPFRCRNGVNAGDEVQGWPRLEKKFRILGTNEEVSHPNELATRRRASWTAPVKRSVDDVEAAFRQRYEKLKEAHPQAVLSFLREGESAYSGWKDAFLWGHDPASVYLDDLGVNHGAKRNG